MKERAPKEFGSSGRRQSIAEELIELDLDLMKTLMRRARLVSKLRGGKKHAATPIAVKAEKEVRAAWEKNAARFSRDDKFSRQLFALLQELEFTGKEEASARGSFNLAPARKPVTVAMRGPSCMMATRLFVALAAAGGGAVKLEHAVLNASLIDAMKALNTAGAHFTWDIIGRPGEGSITNAGTGAPLLFKDKVLYVGEDALNLYLMAFLAVGEPGKVRFTGGTGLKMADLTPLRRFLPELGARFAHNVPKSNGLPGSLEASGMVPDTVTLPEDLPLDALCALLCAAGTWKKRVNIVCGAVPAAQLQKAFALCLPLLRACSVSDSMSGAILSLDGENFSVPSAFSLPLDSVMSAYLLALPLFAGGTVTLGGGWDQEIPHASDVQNLLATMGCVWEASETSVRAVSEHGSAPVSIPGGRLDLSGVPEALLPLGLVLSALAARKNNGICAAPMLPAHADETLVDGFYAYIGFVRDGETLRASSGDDSEAGRTPWTSPGGYWTFAYALAAFMRPGLSVINPASATDVLPSFWSIYNALPNPEVAAKKPKESAVKRRRVIAPGVHTPTVPEQSGDME